MLINSIKGGLRATAISQIECDFKRVGTVIPHLCMILRNMMLKLCKLAFKNMHLKSITTQKSLCCCQKLTPLMVGIKFSCLF